MLAAVLLLSVVLLPDCKKCKDTRLVPCPQESRHACTGPTLRCSVAARCEVCEGTHAVPCPRCGPPGAEHAARREANRAWLAELAPIDADFGRPLAHAKSAHFALTFDIPKLDVSGGESLHSGLHLYLARLEGLHATVSRDLGCTDADYLGATHVFLWAKKADQEKAALAYTLQSSSTESKLMGKAPVVTIFYDQEWLHEEFELHQAVVHQVSHCLLSNVWDGIWPGNIRGGWIDEGLAHAYELALFGEVRHYCYVETDTILALERGAWEVPVRTRLEKGAAPGFLGVAGKNTTELKPDEQLFAWSYVDFLRRAHPTQLGPIARAVKARQPIREALQGTLGWTPFQFEEHWRAFVQENYPLKEKKRR